jgi:hypothetical protein
MGDRKRKYHEEVRYGRTPGPGFGQRSRRGATVEEMGTAIGGAVVKGFTTLGRALGTLIGDPEVNLRKQPKTPKTPALPDYKPSQAARLAVDRRDRYREVQRELEKRRK